MKEKIFLAVGERDFEEYLKQTLKNRYEFVGETTHKEGIVPGVKNSNPNIIVIRETLDGKLGIMDVLYKLRDKFPDVRIILIASPRDRGDKFLATLIQYGVYDFTATSITNIRDVIKLIDIPNKYEDIKGYIPKPELDEKTGQIIFKAPEVEPEMIIHEVVIQEGAKKKKKQGLLGSLNEFLKVKEPDKTGFNETNTNDSSTTTILQNGSPRTYSAEDNSSGEANQEIVLSSSDRILSFISGKSGCGASTVALNTSVLLAKEGFRVILLECNSVSPSIAYWFDLGMNSEGIDTCLQYIKDYEYGKIPKTIVKSEILKNTNSNLQKSYKLLPSGLDFMFFSREYIAGLKQSNLLENIKDLYIHLMFQQGYDFVILDLPSDINNPLAQSGLIFCNKVYSVLNQDVASVGYYLMKIYELQSKGVEIIKKNRFIINKYIEGLSVNEKYLKQWISTNDLILIPDMSPLLIESNAKAIPGVLNGVNVGYQDSIDKIVKSIFKKI